MIFDNLITLTSEIISWNKINKPRWKARSPVGPLASHFNFWKSFNGYNGYNLHLCIRSAISLDLPRSLVRSSASFRPSLSPPSFFSLFHVSSCLSRSTSSSRKLSSLPGLSTCGINVIVPQSTAVITCHHTAKFETLQNERIHSTYLLLKSAYLPGFSPYLVYFGHPERRIFTSFCPYTIMFSIWI